MLGIKVEPLIYARLFVIDRLDFFFYVAIALHEHDLLKFPSCSCLVPLQLHIKRHETLFTAEMESYPLSLLALL